MLVYCGLSYCESCPFCIKKYCMSVFYTRNYVVCRDSKIWWIWGAMSGNNLNIIAQNCNFFQLQPVIFCELSNGFSLLNRRVYVFIDSSKMIGNYPEVLNFQLVTTSNLNRLIWNNLSVLPVHRWELFSPKDLVY